ncbi:FAD-dependent oxidoreductase [Micromonospora sp. NPDC126480]|uniref:FAD-dependent oxidoreductase n=1 Tax=Micromonospora sp. NPDC126480 TaxID=3155312 RepID=UPI00331BCCEE
MTMRITVVGAGLAGALLAWRLCHLRPGARLTLVTGPSRPDATGASGGLVRAFEAGPDEAEAAARSMAELVASPVLRRWSDYREIGSAYLLPGPADARALRWAEELLPGSVALREGAALARALPVRRLPAGVVAVLERRAGFLSPARLRDRVLADLASGGTRISAVPACRVAPDGSVRTRDGATTAADVTVVAAGAWTPALLAASGLAAPALRTKQIQYTRCRLRLPGLGAFVDETTGLYGRPADAGTFLFGLPCDRWDVAPDAVTPDRPLVGQVVREVRRRFGVEPAADGTVASFDCYADHGGLRLRPAGDTGRLFTFTGGSGGAAKTALAASHRAALALPG